VTNSNSPEAGAAPARRGLSETERYLFDTQGCLIIEDALSPSELERLLAGIPRSDDGRVAADEIGDLKNLLDYEEPMFRELVNLPSILPYLEDLLLGPEVAWPDSSPQWSRRFYLSHEYGLFFEAGKKGPWFHGGGTPHEPWLQYQVRNGRIFCGLLAVSYALTDVGVGDGGFWYIPGSHKANFPLPFAIRSYEQIPACVVQPAIKAGSAILFTEALTHGTRAWTAAHERIVLFYKYLPGHMPLLASRSEATLKLATPQQRRFLVAPPAMEPDSE